MELIGKIKQFYRILNSNDRDAQHWVVAGFLFFLATLVLAGILIEAIKANF